MRKRSLAIRRLHSGGIITNYACTSSCAHCLYNCGPHRPADYVEEDTLREVVETIFRWGCSSVHIGGGEPFMAPERLSGVLHALADLDLNVEYVETNSSWFTDLDQACSILTELHATGLRSLLVSVSPFHNARIPFDRVQGVLAACRRTGLHPFVWVPGFIDEIEALDVTVPHKLSEYEERYGPSYVAGIPGRYWIHFGGRSLATFGKALGRRGVEETLERSRGGCDELAQTDHFHIDLYGNYVPGLCSGLAIRMEDLGESLEEARYPLLTALYAGGVQRLFDLATQDHGFEPRERGYLSKCDLCDHIRHHLVHNREIDSIELQPRGFY